MEEVILWVAFAVTCFTAGALWKDWRGCKDCGVPSYSEREALKAEGESR